MRAVIQRVSKASVVVDGEVTGAIDKGLLVLVGLSQGDTEEDLDWIARKLVGLRIFSDAEGKMNRSVRDVGGQILLVSQFTLCADVRKGTRPSFGKAMAPEPAQALFQRLVERVALEVPVQTGRFQAHMDVGLHNDGPVTIILDSPTKQAKA